MTVTSVSESSAPVSRGAGSTAVATGVLGTARVVGDRDRVLMWRDPMRRMPWLFVLLLAIGWPFIVASGPAAVYAVVLGALLVGTQAANAYAIEGSGLWLHLQTITDRARARGELVGHVLAALVPGVVVVVIAIAVQVVVRDAWDDAPAALGICLAATARHRGGGVLPVRGAAVRDAAEPDVRCSRPASPGRRAGASRPRWP